MFTESSPTPSNVKWSHPTGVFSQHSKHNGLRQPAHVHIKTKISLQCPSLLIFYSFLKHLLYTGREGSEMRGPCNTSQIITHGHVHRPFNNARRFIHVIESTLTVFGANICVWSVSQYICVRVLNLSSCVRGICIVSVGAKLINAIFKKLFLLNYLSLYHQEPIFMSQWLWWCWFGKI